LIFYEAHFKTDEKKDCPEDDDGRPDLLVIFKNEEFQVLKPIL
jgi:hypothetical protein